MSEKKAEKDSLIFQEGDVADIAYFVVSGKVQLFQSERNQQVTLRVASENEVFGELALFDSTALRPYSAKAAETCTLLPITPEELKAITEKTSKPLQALFSLITDKMKLGKTKTLPKKDLALDSSITKLTITPNGEKMKSQFKELQIPISNLPYRIGGYPEGGEANKRDTVHLSIASQNSPLRVSRQHCEIAIEEGTLVIVDLGSRLGTTVNGTAIGRGRGHYISPLIKGENTITLGNAEGNYTLTITCE